jgi:hypothetical protein
MGKTIDRIQAVFGNEDGESPYELRNLDDMIVNIVRPTDMIKEMIDRWMEAEEEYKEADFKSEKKRVDPAIKKEYKRIRLQKMNDAGSAWDNLSNAVQAEADRIWRESIAKEPLMKKRVKKPKKEDVAAII